MTQDLGDGSDHHQRLLRQLAPGEPQDLIAGVGQLNILPPVPFKGPPVPMELEAIELNHELLLRPQKVDRPPTNSNVCPGLGKTGLTEEAPHQPLARGAGEVGLIFGPEEGSHAAHPPAMASPGQGGLKLTRPEEPRSPRFGDQPLQFVRGDDRGEVDQRASGGGDGEILPAAQVKLIYLGHATEPDAVLGTTLSADQGYVDRCGRLGQETPKMSCRGPAQDRVWPTGEQSGLLHCAGRQGQVADKVHA